MSKNHFIKVWVTKEFKDDVIKTAIKENHASISGFVRDVLYDKMYKINQFDKLFWILQKDERDKNTKLANKA